MAGMDKVSMALHLATRFQQGPGVYKEEKDVMQVSYSGFI